jgi:hypothetical protein
MTVMGLKDFFEIIATKVEGSAPDGSGVFIVTVIEYPMSGMGPNRTPPCPDPPVLAELYA